MESDPVKTIPIHTDRSSTTHKVLTYMVIQDVQATDHPLIN